MTGGIPRSTYAVAIAATIAIGLTVHLGGGVLPRAARDVLGDALWAVMMVWWVSLIAPRAPAWGRGLAAYAICCVVETSQRYHAPWLDAVRRTTAGHLVLGSGFDQRDFAAYAAGVAAAMALLWTVRPVSGPGGNRRCSVGPGEGHR